MSSRIFYFNITYKCNNNCIFCAADNGLNFDSPEISCQDYLEILEKHHVGVGDTIVLNGGEPTVHKNFLEILRYSKSTGALVDLFTNGKKLSEPKFCDELVDDHRMLIRIPIFGSNAQKHDKLTGMEGNFNALISALDNLINLKKSGRSVELDIKLLLSKATTLENYNIAEFLLNRYRDFTLYSISLNMLIISQFVENHRDVMIEPYTKSVNDSLNLIDWFNERGGALRYSSIPVCLLPSRLRMQRLTTRQSSHFYYFDPLCLEGRLNTETERNCQPCVRCSYNEQCSGFSNRYSNFFGVDEFRAILV